MSRKIASTNWFPDPGVEVAAPLAASRPEPEREPLPDDVATMSMTETPEETPQSEAPATPAVAESYQADRTGRILETLTAATPVAPWGQRKQPRPPRPPKATTPPPARRHRLSRAERRSALAPAAATPKPSEKQPRRTRTAATPRSGRRTRSMRAERRRTRTTWRKVVSLALFAVVVGAWFVTLRPTSLGGPASVLTVRGVSMEPTYRYGDIIIAHGRSDYRPGDIIAFRVPEGEVGAGAVVIHRIIGGDAATGFITQGDNNPDPDEWRPVPTDILGASQWRIPALGRLMAGLRTGPGIAVVAGALAALLVIFGTESHRAHPAARDTKQPDATPAVTAELHSDVAAHREAPEVALDPQPIDPPPVASTPCEGVDSDPLDDLIVPPPLLPVASPGPAAPDAAPQLPIEAAVDEMTDEDGSEDDILSMDLHLGPRRRPPTPEADDDDPSPVGEYWGDLGYLAALLRRPKQEPVVFDDELEPVAAPTLRALD